MKAYPCECKASHLLFPQHRKKHSLFPLPSLPHPSLTISAAELCWCLVSRLTYSRLKKQICESLRKYVRASGSCWPSIQTIIPTTTDCGRCLGCFPRPPLVIGLRGSKTSWKPCTKDLCRTSPRAPLLPECNSTSW